MTTQETPGCWHCVRRLLAKPFKRSSYKVRKTHSDVLDLEASHRPRFNHASPSSQSRSSQSQSQTAGRADRFSAGFPTTVSSTSSFDGAAYEHEYEASIKRTDFMFYCGCDTPKSDRDGAGGALSFTSATEFSEDDDAGVGEERRSVVTTPKISHSMPVFFSPRNAVPMLPRPSLSRKEKPAPMRMVNTRAPLFINVNPVRGRGTDAL